MSTIVEPQPTRKVRNWKTAAPPEVTELLRAREAYRRLHTAYRALEERCTALDSQLKASLTEIELLQVVHGKKKNTLCLLQQQSGVVTSVGHEVEVVLNLKDRCFTQIFSATDFERLPAKDDVVTVTCALHKELTNPLKESLDEASFENFRSGVTGTVVI